MLLHSLADELAYLSEELVSSLSAPEEGPTLLEDLEALHRSLKELESVKGYVQVIERALQFRCVVCPFGGRAWWAYGNAACRSEAAVDEVRKSSTVTVSGYAKLQDFVASVSAACEKIESVASQPDLHLLAFLDNVVEQTWRDIKAVHSS